MAGPVEFHPLGDRAELPAGRPALGQPAGGRGERPADLGGHRLLQRTQVLAGGQGRTAVAIGYDVEGDLQMAGHGGRSHVGRLDQLTGQAPQGPAERGRQRLDGSPGCWASQPSARLAYSGAGTRFRRTALGSDRISSVASSSRNPGTCQLKGPGSIWLSIDTGICDDHPVAIAGRVEDVADRQGGVADRPGGRERTVGIVRRRHRW